MGKALFCQDIYSTVANGLWTWVLAKAVKEHDLHDNNDDKSDILPSCYDGMPWTATFEMVRELAVTNVIAMGSDEE